MKIRSLAVSALAIALCVASSAAGPLQAQTAGPVTRKPAGRPTGSPQSQAPLWAAGRAVAEPARGSVPGELLVAFRPQVTPETREAVRMMLGIERRRVFRNLNVEHWRLPKERWPY